MRSIFGMRKELRTLLSRLFKKLGGRAFRNKKTCTYDKVDILFLFALNVRLY